MYHTLLHIYGPFAVHSYGLMIALGIVMFIWFVEHDTTFKRTMTRDQFLAVIFFGCLIALIGGRIFYALINWSSLHGWDEIIGFEAGFSSLGSLIALLIGLPIVLKRSKIPMLPCLDLFALYGSLIHIMGRFGCFLAGCCYGKPTTLPWHILYTDSNTLAPRYVCLHPTQLYSTAMFIMIFIILYYFIRPLCTKPGQILCSYLLLMNIERFAIDFFRGDQEFVYTTGFNLFSIHQWIALSMIFFASSALLYLHYKHPRINTYESL